MEKRGATRRTVGGGRETLTGRARHSRGWKGRGPSSRKPLLSEPNPPQRQVGRSPWAPAYHLPSCFWARSSPHAQRLEHERLHNQAPILQPRKLRPRKVLLSAQGHTGTQCKVQASGLHCGPRRGHIPGCLPVLVPTCSCPRPHRGSPEGLTGAPVGEVQALKGGGPQSMAGAGQRGKPGVTWPPSLQSLPPPPSHDRREEMISAMLQA